MRIRLFKFTLPATMLLFAAILAANTLHPEESFSKQKEIKLKMVQDWPPISETSPMYSGSNYTDVGARSFLQFMSPRALMAIDTDGNRYFFPGHETVDEKKYTLEMSNRNRIRLCDEYGCISVTERIAKT